MRNGRLYVVSGLLMSLMLFALAANGRAGQRAPL